MKYSALTIATLFFTIVLTPVLAEDAAVPGQAVEPVDVKAEPAAGGGHQAHSPMRGMNRRHGGGQQGMGHDATKHSCGQHAQGGGGKQHRGGGYGKGKHAQVVQRLDRIEARMALMEQRMVRIEGMLESMMWR